MFFLEIDPKNVNALNGQAYTLVEIGSYDQGFSVIEKAVLSNPNNEYLSSTMAFILYNLGKTDEAKSYYQKSLQINANLTSILTEKELTVFNKIII